MHDTSSENCVYDAFDRPLFYFNSSRWDWEAESKTAFTHLSMFVTILLCFQPSKAIIFYRRSLLLQRTLDTLWDSTDIFAENFQCHHSHRCVRLDSSGFTSWAPINFLGVTTKSTQIKKIEMGDFTWVQPFTNKMLKKIVTEQSDRFLYLLLNWSLTAAFYQIQ